MGKIVEKKKKKGRPSLLDLQKRTLKEQQQQQQQEQTHRNSKKSVSANYDSATATPLRRSTRRNSNHSLEDNDEEGDDEEEEELNGKKRREKKLKLVLKLPSSQAQQQSQDNSESRGSDSNHEESNAGSSHKKRKINSIGDGSRIANSKKEEINPVSGANATSNSQGGSQLDSGPSTALPDKKLLLFILDRLQKKDTYGVFSEPVDPKELPDYHEVIEHPMDFGSIRKKLDSSAYANLEQFEKDVFLICSNAMQYNAPDTIYFRQARSILELAKKNFENLRQDSDDNEAEPKVIRRGRPPTKNLKKALGRSSLERLPSEFSSDANLASGAENTDMRKAPLASEKFSFADSSGKGYGSRNDAYSWWCTENRSDRSDEVYMMKNGKKVIVLDENRRNTYKLFHPSAAARDASVLTTFDAERKQLLAVGVYLEHGYSRSLARFAAKLGPVAWRIASQKIERSLSAGVNYGPGWVGENDLPSPRPLLLPSCSLPPGEPTSSQPCPIIQNSFSVGASSAFKTRDDGPYEKSEADNLSEQHEPSVSGGQLSRAIPAYGTTSLSPITRHEKKEISEGLTSSTGTNSTASNAGPVRPRPPFQIHQNHAIYPGMNGYNGACGFNLPAHMAKIMGSARPSGFGFQSTHVSRTATNFLHPAAANSDDDSKFSESSCIKNPSRPSLPGCETIAAARTGFNQQQSQQVLSPKQKPDSRLPPQQKSESVPPSSPSSRRVDSAQPDLALQL